MGRKKKIEIESGVEEKKPHFNIAGDAKRSIVAVFLFAWAVIILLGFVEKAGMAGDYLGKIAGMAIGWTKWVFPLFLVFGGVILLLRKETSFYVSKLIGLCMALISLTGIFHWVVAFLYGIEKMDDFSRVGSGGGYLGFFIAEISIKFLGIAGSVVILGAIFLTSIIISFNFSIVHFFRKIWEKNRKNEEIKEVEIGIDVEKITVDNKNEEGGLDKSDFSFDTKEATDVEIAFENDNIGKIEFVEGRDQYVDQALLNEIVNENEINDKIKSKKNKKTGWKLPPVDLLEKNSGGVNGGDTQESAEIIEKTFKSFGIEVERGEVQVGPAVTQYSFKPAVGIKISKILELNNNLAMALAKHPIRIEAPIPGKSLVGIEVPNDVSSKVRLRNLVESSKFKEKSRESRLTLALGADVSGEYILSDLGKMPHLLIAGSTGTGKSVCVNSIITTLLYQNSPDELKFIMVDPKRVELSMYSGIPHLLSPVITDNGKVVNVLRWVVGEMERRYCLLQDMKSQNIDLYHEKIAKSKKKKSIDSETEGSMEELPYIVVVIDELAELMMSHGKEVEGAIVRIAQLARAVGIHLIVSTQRPEVKIITGLIKANINARIALKVNTQVDSRTILDMSGAEKLLGNGDMLFMSSTAPKMKRIQGIFLSEKEIKNVVKFIKDQYSLKKESDGNGMSNDSKAGLESSKTNISIEGGAAPIILDGVSENDANEDELYSSAKTEVEKAGKASASLLQRRLRIGYSRAARLLDVLEDRGVVGPADGQRPREVYSAENKPQYEEKTDDQEIREKWQI